MTTPTSLPAPGALAHEAKHPATKIAGPYGHPFHPMLVTLPIGAWISALVFDIATRVNDNGSRSLVDASYWLIGIGIVAAIGAAVFGVIDLVRIPRGTRAFATGLTHMALNLFVVALFVVNFLWRRGDYDELAKVRAGQLGLSVAAIAVLAVSGWLGGTLSYHFGVRVADEATQAADGFDQRSARSQKRS